MNADQMKEFVELCKRPAIAGKRGPYWNRGDLFWHIGDDGYEIKDNQCTMKETRNPIYSGDLFMGKECVWLPLVVDYQHPERGLWGMVDWKAVRFIHCETE